MIIDFEKNRKLYFSVHPQLEEGFNFIDTLKNKPVGVYEGNQMFAMVQEGTTGSGFEKKLETHKKYIDVQFMVSGSEVMEWKNVEKLVEYKGYDSKADITFYEGTGNAIRIEEGMFYIVFPEDAHKPCTHLNDKNDYRKIVLKLRV